MKSESWNTFQFIRDGGCQSKERKERRKQQQEWKLHIHVIHILANVGRPWKETFSRVRPRSQKNIKHLKWKWVEWFARLMNYGYFISRLTMVNLWDWKHVVGFECVKQLWDVYWTPRRYLFKDQKLGRDKVKEKGFHSVFENLLIKYN